MNDLFNYVITKINEMLVYSRSKEKEVFVKVENDAIFVNELTYMPNDVRFSKTDIEDILLYFRENGAKEYKHAENAVYFKNRDWLVKSNTR